MNNDKLHLSARENPDGELRVYDQDGREVEGVVSINFEIGVDQASIITMRVHDMRDGRVWSAGRVNRK